MKRLHDLLYSSLPFVVNVATSSMQMAFKDFLAFLKGAWSLHDVHFQRADLGGHAVVEGCWVISQKSDAAQGQKTWGQVIDDQNILSEESISHL